VAFCVSLLIENRTPELNFSAEKFSEAVPRPRASDGERESRGKILSRAQSQKWIPPVSVYIVDISFDSAARRPRMASKEHFQACGLLTY